MFDGSECAAVSVGWGKELKVGGYLPVILHLMRI